MADLQPPIEFDFGENGGEVRFADTAAVRRWVERERRAWEWLAPTTPQANPLNIADHVQSHLGTISSQLTHAEADPAAHQPGLVKSLRNAYSANPPNLWHSISPTGRTILDIYESEGPASAAFAYGFSRGATSIANVSGREHLRGALLVSVPSLMPSANISAVLGAQRQEFADTFNRIDDSLRQDAAKRAVELETYLSRAKRVAWKSLTRARKRWLDERSAVRTEANEAIGSIQTVEAAYKGHMQLNASVGYWGDKATAHGISRSRYRTWLGRYALAATAAVVVSFWLAGALVLETAGYEVVPFIEVPPPRSEAGTPTAVYFIVSGFLAIVSTLVFWVGRLLVRLYLSEHHLQRDANERVTMVKTYLALIKDKAVSEAERALALQALFRTSSDGIVKDDGMSDAGLQAAATKLLLQNNRSAAA